MTQNDASIQEARRAAFESAIRLKWSRILVNAPFRDEYTDSLLKREKGKYVNRDTREQWWAWNDALDSVVVELPEVEYFGDYWSGGYAIKKQDVVEAIEAAGIKVKP